MNFDLIAGHAQQKDLLKRALQTGRVAHAYLFEGPDGVGKRLMALAMARALFCDNGQGCSHCPACRKVDHNNHPDLHIVSTYNPDEPEEQTLKIERIRELQRDLSYRPLSASRKVCLIDGAEKMNSEASNALLKTLEEPPGQSVIILLSSQPEKLLTTVRSRCQRVPFRRLPYALLKRTLLDKLGLSDEQAHLMAALSEGSLKRALGKDRELYLEERPELIKRVLGLSAGSARPLLALAEELKSDKERLPEKIDVLQAFYRDALLLKYGRTRDEIVNVDLFEAAYGVAEGYGVDALLTKLDALEQVTKHLARNVNNELALDVLLQQLAA